MDIKIRTEDLKVWFGKEPALKGITTEVFYPRLDVPNMQDMQFIITDGSTFVDLERDATNHVVSMPDEKALEYTVTNTDKRATPKYRITNTYITDPSRSTLLIQTRFQSLDGGTYRLYLLENPSMAGGGANDNAWWDSTNSALMSSGTETLFAAPMTVVAALKVAAPNAFVAHDIGYAHQASDCYVDLAADNSLDNQFDNVAGNGNVVECGQIGGLGADDRLPVEKAAAMEHRLAVKDLHDPLREAQQGLVAGVLVPLEPTDLVVLRVGVIVAALRAPDLVSRADHRDTLRNQQRAVGWG